MRMCELSQSYSNSIIVNGQIRECFGFIMTGLGEVNNAYNNTHNAQIQNIK